MKNFLKVYLYWNIKNTAYPLLFPSFAFFLGRYSQTCSIHIGMFSDCQQFSDFQIPYHTFLTVIISTMGMLTPLLMVVKVKKDYQMLKSQLNSLSTVLSTHAVFIQATAKLKIVVYH